MSSTSSDLHSSSPALCSVLPLRGATNLPTYRSTDSLIYRLTEPKTAHRQTLTSDLWLLFSEIPVD